jgi:hypothetical protein
MKRKGALLISGNDDGTFNLSFYPNVAETFEPEVLADVEFPNAAQLVSALASMGLAGTGPEFVSRLEAPPGIFVLLDVMLSKKELRDYGLLARDPLAPMPPPGESAELPEEDEGLEANE